MTLTAGGSQQAQFTVTVPSGVTAGEYNFVIQASGTVQGGGAVPLPAVRAFFMVVSSPGPALTVTSTPSGSFALGQTGTYGIQVSNAYGAGSDGRTFTVRQPPPIVAVSQDPLFVQVGSSGTTQATGSPLPGAAPPFAWTPPPPVTLAYTISADRSTLTCGVKCV